MTRTPTGAPAPAEAVEIELLPLGAASALYDAWNNLLLRAVEPSILAGPDFLLPALETFAPGARLLVAHRGSGGERRLVAVAALIRPRFRLLRLATVHTGDFAPLGVPLVDADRPEEILAALLAALARRTGGLVLPHLPLDGPFAAALDRAAAGRPIWTIAPHERAELRAGTSAADLDRHAGRKRRHEWRRQARRLAETGTLHASLATGAAAPAAFAEFLRLEAAGWKGRDHTALADVPEIRRFAERAVAALAEHDRVAIDRLDLDGRPLAMLVSFGVAGRWVSWKTAYDEAFAANSPGARVLLNATERFLGDDAFVEADSLAVADHPLMNPVWPGRRRIATRVIGLGRTPLVAWAAALELRLAAALRRMARDLRDRWRARR